MDIYIDLLSEPTRELEANPVNFLCRGGWRREPLLVGSEVWAGSSVCGL